VQILPPRASMIGQRRLVGSLVPLSIQQTKLVPPLIFNLAYGVTVKLGKMKKKKKKKKKKIKWNFRLISV
jgi:hypothetical protein